jgi:hypothetical protein
VERNPDLGKLRYAHAAPQDSSTAVAAPVEAPVGAADGARPRSGFRSLLGMRVTKRADGRDANLLELLEADTLLLREENARLRVKLEAPPDAGRVIERLRALPGAPRSGDAPSADDDAWHMLTELVVMRNSLLQICREMGQALAGLETQLVGLEIPHGSRADAEPANGSLQNPDTTNGHRSNGHLKEARAQ